MKVETNLVPGDKCLIKFNNRHTYEEAEILSIMGSEIEIKYGTSDPIVMEQEDFKIIFRKLILD